MTALLMLAIAIGERRELDVLTKSRILSAFRKIPDQIREFLSDTTRAEKLAGELAKYDHCFFLGRYYQFPIALE